MDPELPAPVVPPVPTTGAGLPTTGLEGAGTVVPDTAVDPVQRLADGVLESAREALGSLGRVWAAGPRPFDRSAVGQVAGALVWYLTAAAVVAVLVAGGRMAWQRRGAPARELAVALGTLVLVTGAGTAAVGLAVTAADGLAGTVLGVVTSDPAEALDALVDLDGLATASPVTVLLVGSGVLLAALALVAVLVVRVVGLVVLTGVLPVSTAAVNTGPGRSAGIRVATWLVALVVCQPAAALVLAAGVVVVPELPGVEDPTVRALAGGVVLLLAVLTLPAAGAALRPALTGLAGRGSGAPADRLPSGAVPLPRGATTGRAAALGPATGRPAPAGSVLFAPRAARRGGGGAPVAAGGSPGAARVATTVGAAVVGAAVAGRPSGEGAAAGTTGPGGVPGAGGGA